MQAYLFCVHDLDVHKELWKFTSCKGADSQTLSVNRALLWMLRYVGDIRGCVQHPNSQQREPTRTWVLHHLNDELVVCKLGVG